MKAFPALVQHQEHRKSKALRITKVGQDVKVFVFAAGIQQCKNIIGFQERINLCVFMYKFMKT